MMNFVLGGGCFWCVDAVYKRVNGVTHVESGYSGGDSQPTYEQVSTGETEHAEVVRVSFDESVIPPEELLAIFFLAHDPTTKDRQGADVGHQYRSVMFYANEEQKRLFEAARSRAQKHWSAPIITEIAPLKQFFRAEEYHQDYFDKNPEVGYCQVVIQPKLTKARAAAAQWFKEDA